MKKTISSLLLAAAGCFALSSCIDVIDPQSGTVTVDQATKAPGSFQKFVDAITSQLAGQFTYQQQPYDFGYSSFFLIRDVQGQDIALNYAGDWYSAWYQCGTALGPNYSNCQFTWTTYYKWIKNCNQVISLAGTEPTEAQKSGAGIAYAMRAMFYMDLARMFAQKTYALDKESLTVPIINEDPNIDLTHNPRVTNEVMWKFILSDLDKAEEYLKDFKRENKYVPDESVVYGLKARAYLTMEDWPNAEKYAKMAQNGYQEMTESQYTDHNSGFNEPNDSWMFGVHFQPTDGCVTFNDGDSSWGSEMCFELDKKLGVGYASAYGNQKLIDYHLYETIPSTDFRKKVFIDFKIDDLKTKDKDGKVVIDEDKVIEALKPYTDYPENVLSSNSRTGKLGGFSLKFRLAGGDAGRKNQYVGYCVSVPLMRVEEMKLIEAEAAGMQDEARGIELLTKFAKTRDPQYVYGKHNEAYGNSSTSKFQNEVWWQRRVELWGEGFATFDIKRLNKGIIRNYAGTDHLAGYRWNTTTPPDWMNWCIVGTEADYNFSIQNNPTPMAPTGDSEEFVW